MGNARRLAPLLSDHPKTQLGHRTAAARPQAAPAHRQPPRPAARQPPPHGPVMRLTLGLTTAVVVSSRDAAREAFTKHDRRLAAHAVPDNARALGFAGRSMIWLPSTDPMWRTLRGIVATHVFSPRSLAAARDVRERKVRDLVAYFRGRAGQEVDFGEAVYGGVINLVSSVVFSADVVDVGEESALAEASSMPKHNDFLDAPIDLMSKGKISHDSVTIILVDVFAAGSDTTTVTLEWAMAELLRNQSIMSKVRTEVENSLGDKGTIQETDVASMPYLQAVVKEAMRGTADTPPRIGGWHRDWWLHGAQGLQGDRQLMGDNA
ncbi:hypothetical protein ACP70R_017588 [Stipagrostis hirtigluma subsp. patula]